MNDEKLKQFKNILKAAPCKEEPDLPFKMPRGEIADLTDLVPGLNRKILKDKKPL